MAKDVTEKDFADAQDVIDGGGVAYVGGRTARTPEELDFIRDAVEAEKSADPPPTPRPAFSFLSPAPVPGVEFLSQPLTEAELMAAAAGTQKGSSPRVRAASVSQAQTGERDGNAGGTTGPQGGEAARAVPPPAPAPADLPLSDAQRQALAAAGYDSRAKLAAASDEQLKAVPGIGDASIGKIRDLYPAT